MSTTDREPPEASLTEGLPVNGAVVETPKSGINKPVFYISSAIIVAITAWAMIAPDNATP